MTIDETESDEIKHVPYHEALADYNKYTDKIEVLTIKMFTVPGKIIRSRRTDAHRIMPEQLRTIVLTCEEMERYAPAEAREIDNESVKFCQQVLLPIVIRANHKINEGRSSEYWRKIRENCLNNTIEVLYLHMAHGKTGHKHGFTASEIIEQLKNEHETGVLALTKVIPNNIVTKTLDGTITPQKIGWYLRDIVNKTTPLNDKYLVRVKNRHEHGTLYYIEYCDNKPENKRSLKNDSQ